MDYSDSTLTIIVSGPDNVSSEEKIIREELMRRASQLSDISWVPLGPIPTQGGEYVAGHEILGIPYSSVKEEEKFVGQYVSFYTFKTAVDNPKSVLYTENVMKAPYHGTNCSTYYGTVCSMAVNYVLGLPYSYATSNYKSLDDFFLVVPQAIDSIEPGDILLKDGAHVVVIIDASRVDGRISSVSILESYGGGGTHIYEYTRNRLLDRWHRDEWELLRFTGLDRIVGLESMAFNDYPYDIPFNSPMCCSRGDRAAFREGEDVVLNNLDGKQHSIRILREGQDVGMVETDGTDVVLSTLQPGVYCFDLSNPSWDNPFIEVLEASVSVNRNEKDLQVFFSSCNGKPMSIILCNLNGGHYLVQPITDVEREDGFITVKIPDHREQLYLKVMFEGQYGSVTNEPIAI